MYLAILCLAIAMWRLGKTKFELTKKHVALYGHDFSLLEQLTEQCYFAGARVTLLYSSLESRAAVSRLRTLELHLDRSAHIKCVEFNPARATQSLTEAERKSYGDFDLLIVCSGFYARGEFTENGTEDVKAAMENNYLQSVELLRHVGRRMHARGGGRICIVESAAAYFSLPGVCSAAAGALNAFAEIMRCELPSVTVVLCALSLLESQRRNHALIGTSVTAQEAAKSVLTALKVGKPLSTDNVCHRLISITTEGATARFALFSDTLLSSLSVLLGFVYWRLYLPWARPVSSS